jgi:hypothetical protein
MCKVLSHHQGGSISGVLVRGAATVAATAARIGIHFPFNVISVARNKIFETRLSAPAWLIGNRETESNVSRLGVVAPVNETSGSHSQCREPMPSAISA